MCKAQEHGEAHRREIALANENTINIIRHFDIRWDTSFKAHANTKLSLGTDQHVEMPYDTDRSLIFKTLFDAELDKQLQS